jgi:hypothetical protein
MDVSVFLSHSCQDDPLPHQLASELRERGIVVLIDPFDPGDRTCAKIQELIKGSSHFVLFFTESCSSSRWVRIECRFAKLCYDLGGITVLPISVDGAQPYDFLEQFIAIRWSTGNALGDLSRLLSECITGKQRAGFLRRLSEYITGKRRAGILSTDVERAELEEEGGRELEREHARTNKIGFLHKAVQAYDRAIQLDFCNHNAWANKAWSLFKLGEKSRALDFVEFAKLLRPDSRHVQDVQKRIMDGTK